MSEPASDEATETDESTEREPDLEAIEEEREKRLDPDIGPFNDPNSEEGEAEA